MGYQKCLELAGAEVLLFENFGSYQGDWWAKVKYKDKIGWVNGSFGSCSCCDAFQAEFNCNSHEHKDNDYVTYDNFPEEYKENCPYCQDLMKRMIDFGKQYLDDIITQEKAERKASENLDWDMGAKEILDFIKNNSISN